MYKIGTSKDSVYNLFLILIKRNTYNIIYIRLCLITTVHHYRDDTMRSEIIHLPHGLKIQGKVAKLN